MKQRPSDSVMSAVVSAIAAIDADPAAPRTKEHLGRLADIAHATIHRAFKYDAENSSPLTISERWNAVTTENFAELADFAGYQANFLKLFGFGLDGVDYSADTDVAVSIPSIA